MSDNQPSAEIIDSDHFQALLASRAFGKAASESLTVALDLLEGLGGFGGPVAQLSADLAELADLLRMPQEEVLANVETIMGLAVRISGSADRLDRPANENQAPSDIIE
jgi:hypothetical protein